MKTLHEYFDPDTDSYEYTIKIGLQSEMSDDELSGCLEDCLQRYEVVALEHVNTTPYQRQSEDFPDLENLKVAFFRVATEYPVTDTLLTNAVAKDLGLTNTQIKVCKDYDPMKDDEESLLYGVSDDEYDPILGNDDYSDSEDLEESLHGNDYTDKNNKEIADSAKDRRASIRVWKSKLIPEQKLDREEDQGIQTNHDKSSASPLSNVYRNKVNKDKNSNGALSPIVRESRQRKK